MNVETITKVGTAAKYKYDDGTIVYRMERHLIELRGDNIRIQHDYLHPNAAQKKYNLTFGQITDQYGANTAEEYCDYLIENGFFLDSTVITDTAGNAVGTTSGALDVSVQDATTEPIDTYFLQGGPSFSLALDVVISTLTLLTYDFEAAPGHGIVIGNEIILLEVEHDRQFYAVVTGVAGDTITLDRPIDHDFKVAEAFGQIVSSNMNVNGSVTEQIFTVRAGTVPSDINRLFLSVLDSSSMDDGKFGSLPALTRGLVLRYVDGFQKTIFCFKTNLEIKEFCYDLNYASKAAAGSYGMIARMSFNGQDKHGVVLRLRGTDALQWVVQDDLTGLDAFKATAQGSKTSGEV
jgi:hypothetical protein